ncbi:helix-turn-helix domain-containing protein [Streptomyces hayashii]|uniref:helix-turn-helix domain-containing protein n=1 Tax=Streptomyces hayashii TaxID=2839966 RepID=UPI00403D26FB
MVGVERQPCFSRSGTTRVGERMTTPPVRQRRQMPEGQGQMIRAARERAGLGVRQAARQAAISGGYLANIEAGARCPSVRVAERLADVLQLDDTERARLLAVAVTDAGWNSPWRAARQHGSTSPTSSPPGAA